MRQNVWDEEKSMVRIVYPDLILCHGKTISEPIWSEIYDLFIRLLQYTSGPNLLDEVCHIPFGDLQTGYNMEEMRIAIILIQRMRHAFLL